LAVSMMWMYLSMWTHAHIYSWKLGPGLVLLAKVCPWLSGQKFLREFNLNFSEILKCSFWKGNCWECILALFLFPCLNL
jgi:hypothetical protein